MILAASGPRPCFDGWQSHSDWLDFNLIKFSYFATLLVFASLSFLYFFYAASTDPDAAGVLST